MNIASCVRKAASAGVCAGFVLVCAADTLEVPVDTTVQLSADIDYSGTTVEMKGGTLDQNGVKATLGGLTVSDGTVNRLVDTGDASSPLTINEKVELKYGAQLHIDSGVWNPSGLTWTIGLYGYAEKPTIFEISGDDTRFTVNRTKIWYFSDNAPTIVNFSGRHVTFTGGHALYLTAGAKGNLQWNVSGGTHTFSDVLRFGHGEVELNISGGTLEPQYIRMGQGTDNVSDVVNTHTINQTGGELKVSNEFCLLKNHNDGTSRSACNTVVNLDGGVTLAPKLFANSSTKGATSTLTADGGTLKPTGSSATFIDGINNFLLGEKGLTVDVGGYTTTIPQAVTGVKEGASFGLLAKKGSATLKLTGAIAKGVKVENDEGQGNQFLPKANNCAV